MQAPANTYTPRNVFYCVAPSLTMYRAQISIPDGITTNDERALIASALEKRHRVPKGLVVLCEITIPFEARKR